MSGGHSKNAFAVLDGDKLTYFAMGEQGIIRLRADDMPADLRAGAPVYVPYFSSNANRVPSGDAIKALADGMHQERLRGDNDSTIPAGYTYLAQFIFHDITLLSERDDLLKSRVSAALDMDSVLGIAGSPAETASDNPKNALRIGMTLADFGGKCALPDDVPRKPKHRGVAHDDLCPRGYPLIPDDRNEGFLQLSQMHVLFLKFYNAIARRNGFGEDHYDDDLVKRLFQQHVQSIALHDLLEKLTDRDVFHDVVELDQRKVIHPKPINRNDPFYVPQEFAFAAARFGHSMVREQYDWNDVHEGTRPAQLPFLITHSYRNGGPGGQLTQLEYDWVIDWSRFFDLSGARAPVMASRIGTRLAKTMGELPMRILVKNPNEDPIEDVERFEIARTTLQRQIDLSMASAQTVACKLKDSAPIEELTPEELAGDPESPIGKAFDSFKELYDATPIWFYVLREAEVKGHGNHLGPMGSRLLAETIHAAIEAAGTDAITAQDDWRQSLAEHGDKAFRMRDLISFVQAVEREEQLNT